MFFCDGALIVGTSVPIVVSGGRVIVTVNRVVVLYAAVIVTTGPVLVSGGCVVVTVGFIAVLGLSLIHI